MHRTYSREDFELVQRLLMAGLGEREIARRIGIPRSTVGYWHRNPVPRRLRRSLEDERWRPSSPCEYAYVLGLYLGDGHLVQRGRAAFLRIACDPAYPAIIDEAAAALAAVFPEGNVRRYRSSIERAVDLQLSHPALLAAFPQHGAGPKHTRRIRLVGWQQEVTEQHAESFLRGLIHSDGSRTINRFTTRLGSGRTAEYSYPRYFFTNLSYDIRRIFCHHCELLGIRWTQSNPKNISVAHRRSVAILDSFVGPKR